jgi:iron(III) transport system ATP-binding protein
VNPTLSPSSTPALCLAGVSKRFGSTPAVTGVDLAVADGELLALVGPSGCGKSTLLRIVAGLVAADSGTVRVGEHLVDDGHRLAAPEDRDVGLVFQEHSLFPHMTVGANLMFGLRHMSNDDRRRHRDHWLEVVGLPGTADRYPHELSGGERQRVALARALAPHPRLMLLDEPFASLDPNRRAQIRHDVVSVLRSAGTAAVFVTHDQQEALAIGDRVAVMNAGAIEQMGTPDDVFHRPVNRFVAGFMGEANFLTIDRATGATELGSEHAGSGTLVARPGDISFGSGVAATVLASEFRGATRLHTVRLGSGIELMVSTDHTVEPAPGSQVMVSLRPGAHAVVE